MVGDMERILVQRLALERCRNDLAHLCALMHLSGPDNSGDTGLDNGPVYHLITSMNEELGVIEESLDALVENHSGQ